MCLHLEGTEMETKAAISPTRFLKLFRITKTYNMSKQHPILFSTAMIQAILERRKTKTRRVVTKQNSKVDGLYSGFKFLDLDFNDAIIDGSDHFYYLKVKLPKMDTIHRVYPKWEVGDILWVREMFADANKYFRTNVTSYVYKTGPKPKNVYGRLSWKPPIFMPYDACRLFLKITDIKGERLQDISPDDALNEGINYWNVDRNALEGGEFVADYENYTWTEKKEADPNYEDRYFPTFANPIDSFRSLWQLINGPQSWDNNPFVWAISFDVVDKPLNK